MARVTVAFKGVVDGKVYPQDFVPGDLVYGSLAEEVVKAGWANEDESAPYPAPQQNSQDSPSAQTPKGDGSEQDAPTTEIPADWQSLTWPKLRSLAAQVAPGSTSTKDDAIAGIQAYIDANVPAVDPPEAVIEPSTGGDPAAIDAGSSAAPSGEAAP